MTFHNKIRISVFVVFMFLTGGVYSQLQFSTSVVVGAEQTNIYVSLLEGKNVVLVANQSSMVEQTHLVDTLLQLGIKVTKVFCPEHGFRGVADAGEKVDNTKDSKTGLPLISLYGKHKKPTSNDLQSVDVVVFDIQDVGVRFYTYISTLHYVMEACAENHIPLLVLDRPNPNGFYVDGPVLDSAAKSFVGMHKVPLVHGMTIGEYALMINGENWLNDDRQCDVSVIPCKNYNHNTLYELPIKPSPNLPNIRSVLLYPSLGLFEGTVISVGRGTDFSFQVFGHPKCKKGDFEFTPLSKQGAKKPKYMGEICKGDNLQVIDIEEIIEFKQIHLTYLLKAYSALTRKTDFFNTFFYKLAGTHKLQQQIEGEILEEEIRASWQNEIEIFKKIRKQYLLYSDFE